MTKKHLSEATILVTLIALSSCSSAQSRLNDKLVGVPLSQQLDILQNECFSTADQYHGTLLPQGQPQKYLLSKICSDMGTQIEQINNQKSEGKASPDAFQKLYDSCIKESEIYGVNFAGRHARSSSHREYYYRTRAICNTYQNILSGLTQASN